MEKKKYNSMIFVTYKYYVNGKFGYQEIHSYFYAPACQQELFQLKEPKHSQ